MEIPRGDPFFRDSSKKDFLNKKTSSRKKPGGKKLVVRLFYTSRFFVEN